MNLVLFDNGGTLVDDPFDDVLAMLYPECLDAGLKLGLTTDDLPELFNYWREENSTTDYPFASHYLQEETWIVNSLLRLNTTRGTPDISDIPLISLSFLRRYRELARMQISKQPQLPLVRELFAWLKSTNIAIGVASNDREYSTNSIMAWTGLSRYLDWIFSSEGLSKKYPKAEKPRPEFFNAILKEIKRPITEWSCVLYVGDSERNDILPAKAAGITTIRYINEQNPKNSSWVDPTMDSVADYRCSERSQILSMLQAILT